MRGREGEVGPALRAGNRVHLVEDDRVDSPERLTPSRSKDAAAPGRVRLDRRGVQLIEGPEECGEGLAAAGGRNDEDVLPGGDRRPCLLLGQRGRGERGIEPGLRGRSEACGHARHGRSTCSGPRASHTRKRCIFMAYLC